MKKLSIIIALLAVSGLASANGSAYRIYKLAYFTPGSLRLNVKRVARSYGWKTVVWKAPDDYTWVTYTKIPARNLPKVMRAVLTDYPLQAVFYKGNHVLLIQPRTLR